MESNSFSLFVMVTLDEVSSFIETIGGNQINLWKKNRTDLDQRKHGMEFILLVRNERRFWLEAN